MPNRAAIYARYSSDLQSDRSIDDQLALCRSFAQRERLVVVDTFHDKARSGASVIGRDGLMSLMDAARDRAFDVLVVEALDRVSRDQEDLAGIYKRLSFLGIEIRAVHDGKADAVQVGIRGLVGALYLQDLAHKIRRGMTGRVAAGASPGGKAYGYAAVAGSPGELAIVDAEAEIVRRIFAEFNAGRSPRDIAAGLNGDGIAPPRGSYWAGNTINGSRKRNNGILQNPLYDGRLIWNRTRMIKDPDTGKRVSRSNPPSEWQEKPAEHLRIVEADTFAAATARRGERVGAPSGPKKGKRFLSGLLKCGRCGTGMSIAGKMGRVTKVTRIVCTRAKESRACDNHKPYRLEDIEATVLTVLRRTVADRQAIEYFVKAYNAVEKARFSGSGVERQRLTTRLAMVGREFDRATDLAVKGILSDDEARSKLTALREERADIEARLRDLPETPKVVTLRSAVAAQYLRTLDAIEALLVDAGPTSDELRGKLRKMVSAVVVHPTEAGRPPEVEVKGFLSAYARDLPEQKVKCRGGLVVAEERFAQTPHTFPVPFSHREAVKRTA